MASVHSWLPPSRENWELLTRGFALMPLVTVVQWFTHWYPQGKTSTQSRFNIPGKLAWATMETPGFVVLLYTMFTLPNQLGTTTLPRVNWLMAGLFTTHYIYRALLSPLFLNPSMSPIHPLIWVFAVAFQLANGLSLGGWLGGYGPTAVHDWAGAMPRIYVGLLLWAAGLAGNIWHEDELREIRRQARRRQERERSQAKGKGGVDKHYAVPQNGLFGWILYPHYLCEWIEWAGFWLIAGWGCAPARTFLVNEIATMLPRAVQGREWYIQKFGKEKVGSRRAVLPGLL